MSASIRVALRVRPENESTESVHESSSVANAMQSVSVSDGNAVTLRKHRDNGMSDLTHQYSFDKVFEADSTQEEVFSNVRDLIDESLKGFNVTIFAFGMTGSGKTHTISGDDKSPDRVGIVPRTVHHVFHDLRRQAAVNKENVAMVFLTFVELYNNTFYDLLAPDIPYDNSDFGKSGTGSSSSGGGGLKLHEHPIRGMQLSGSPTLRTPVSSAEETLRLVNRGYKLRATASTNLNEHSSRSHTVLTLEIVTRSSCSPLVHTSTSSSGTGTGKGEKDKQQGQMRFGKIHLVDLAGSERVKLSGAEGQTLEEAKQINKALSVLGDVLNSLSKLSRDQAKAKDKESAANASLLPMGSPQPATQRLSHIPYRNSKLTMLLKDSLGGNAKTMMIATIRLSAAFYQQTLTSLQYAARARHIRCNPVQNLTDGGDVTGDGASMQKTLGEVTRLKSQLDERTREFNALKEKLENIERVQRLAAVQRKQDLKDGKVKAESGAGSGAEEQYQLDRESESREVDTYRKQIEKLRSKSTTERQELQDAMKFVIHNHEGHLAVKEREYVNLEIQLQTEQNKVEALSRDKNNALDGKKKVEGHARELFELSQEQQREIHALKQERQELIRRLEEANDQAAAVSMSNSDREQFVQALQKLTESRGKHKNRADALERGQDRLSRESRESESREKDKTKIEIAKSERMREQLEALKRKYIAKDGQLKVLAERVEVFQNKSRDQDKLMSKAAIRIRTLEARVEKQSKDEIATQQQVLVDNKSSGEEDERVQESQDDSAAATASAIVIASAEAGAQEIALVRAQQKDEIEALGVQFQDQILEAKHERKNEIEALKRRNQAQRSDLENSLQELSELREAREGLKQEKQEKQEQEAEDTEERIRILVEKGTLLSEKHEEQAMELQSEVDDLAQINKQLRDAQLEQQSELDQLRSKLQISQSELGGARERVEVMEQQQEAREGREGSLDNTLAIAAQNNKNNKNNENNNENGVKEKEGEEEDSQEEESSDSDNDNDKESSQDEESALSPTTENKVLKSTISQLKVHEQYMFKTLETKLLDLDDARGKLLKLKAISAKQQSAQQIALQLQFQANNNSPIPSPTHALRAADQKISDLQRRLKDDNDRTSLRVKEALILKQTNQELEIRLENSKRLLAQERDMGKEMQEEIDSLRAKNSQDLARMQELVKSSVVQGQERRMQEVLEVTGMIGVSDPLFNDDDGDNHANDHDNDISYTSQHGKDLNSNLKLEVIGVAVEGQKREPEPEIEIEIYDCDDEGSNVDIDVNRDRDIVVDENEISLEYFDSRDSESAWDEVDV